MAVKSLNKIPNIPVFSSFEYLQSAIYLLNIFCKGYFINSIVETVVH